MGITSSVKGFSLTYVAAGIAYCKVLSVEAVGIYIECRTVVIRI